MSTQNMTLAEYNEYMAAQKTVSKYRAKATDGIGPNGEQVLYASMAEQAYAFGLHLQKKEGQIADWCRQPVFCIMHGNELLCEYRGDFLVTHLDGSKEIIECKGYIDPQAAVTRLWRLKVKLLEVFWLPLHPDTTHRIVES